MNWKDPNTKKSRVYLTSKTYLNKVRSFCFLLLTFAAVGAGVLIFQSGVTFISLGVAAGILFTFLLVVTYVWKQSRTVSLKGDNLLLKSMDDRSVVAPIRSVREVRTKRILGVEHTRFKYHLDGQSTRFFILTKPNAVTPEEIICKKKEERKRKKEANHKPDSVLTPMV